MLCWSARPRYWRQTVSAEHIRVDVPLAYTSPTKCPRLYYQNFYINSGTDSWLIVNRLIRSLNRLLGAKTEKNWNISDPKTSQLDWGPVWPYRRHGSAIGRRRQQRFETGVAIGDLYIDIPRARVPSALFLSSSCWDSAGGASVLYIFRPTCSKSLSRRQGRASWRYSVSSGPACLLGSSAPPPLPRAARAEFSAACLPCGASIPPTTIVLRQLVRYGGRTKRWEGVH